MKVTEVNDFQFLRDDWNRILKCNLLGDNVFLTWEWLSTWWKHFGEGRRLLILMVEDDNELLAIAPLMLSSYKMPGFGSIRKIEFVGSRHSDYGNLIVVKNEMECMKLIIGYLKDTIEHWDWIELKEIPDTAAYPHLLQPLSQNPPSDLILKMRVCNLCPYISLPASFDLLIKGLEKKLQQNLNRRLRRIREKHRVELKRFDEAGFSVKEAMKVFIKLHEARWATEGLLGAFRSKEAAFRNFHMEAAELFADRQWLGLYFLTASDEPISTEYAYEYGHKVYAYLSGSDPSYSSYSVGNLIVMLLLDRCVKHGVTEYDMMRGDEPYKFVWTQSYRSNFEMRLVKKELHSRFFDWVTWNDAVGSLAVKLKLSLRARVQDRK